LGDWTCAKDEGLEEGERRGGGGERMKDGRRGNDRPHRKSIHKLGTTKICAILTKDVYVKSELTGKTNCK
jgi:hypothetical protein